MNKTDKIINIIKNKHCAYQITLDGRDYFTITEVSIDEAAKEIAELDNDWPKVGEWYLYASPTSPDLHDESYWNKDDIDQHRKDNNLIFKTKEEAIARAKEMLGI